MRSLLIILPIYLALFIGIPVFIGVYVYRDANRRGMNAALWTLVSILAPALIGFIVYLLVRGSYSDLKCPRCDATVTEQYTVCPQCGTKLKASCGTCGFPVEPGWTVCPQCAAALSQDTAGITPPVRRQDRVLWKILVAVIAIPLALLVVGFVSFNGISGGYSMATAHFSAAEYEDNAQVTAWLSECDADVKNAYALCYTGLTDQGKEKVTRYLIYCPSADAATDMSVSPEVGMFKKELCVFFTGTSAPAGEGCALTAVIYHGDVYLEELSIRVNDQDVACEITTVDYNPTSLVHD